MRKMIEILMVVVWAGVAFPALGQDEPQSVTFRYIPPKTPSFVDLEGIFKRDSFLERLSITLSSGLRLPQQLTIALAECKQSNAFYQPKYRAVILCYELIDEVGNRVVTDFVKKGRKELGQEIMGGALAFVLMHELGHALIHILQLPITGREEDVADQIATYLLLKQSRPFNLVQGAAWFNDKRQLRYVAAHFAGQHSLDQQRKFNVVCWAFGKDPSTFYGLAQAVKLPPNRASRCANEYQQMNRAITSLMSDYVRLN